MSTAPTAAPTGTFLSVDLCPRHGFAMLAMATLDDQGTGGGTRLLGPKSCCPDRREVARWRVSADDLACLAAEMAPPAPTLLQRLMDRVALLDRVIGEHHSASIMREEHPICPVCMEAGGTDFFATTGALLREARHVR